MPALDRAAQLREVDLHAVIFEAQPADGQPLLEDLQGERLSIGPVAAQTLPIGSQAIAPIQADLPGLLIALELP